MKRTLCMISIITLLFVSLGANYTYATVDELDQSENSGIDVKTIFEDILKLKEIIKAIYEKISQAGKVDDDLKDDIKGEIDKIDEIDSIGDDELGTIKDELNSKVDDLTDDNLEESKDNLGTIKDIIEVLPDNEEEFNEQKVQYGERIIKILQENEKELGDLKELQVVINTINEDLNKATTVDDELKNKLREDVNKLDTVTGINPTLSSALKIVLNMQIDELTDENLNSMKIVVLTIKKWVDKKVEDSNNNNNNGNTDNDNNNNNSNNNNSNGNNNNNNDNKTEDNSKNDTNIVVDDTIAKDTIPHAGKIGGFIGIGISLLGIAIVYGHKYKKLKGI